MDGYDNVYDRQWANRLSASLSWAEEGEEEEQFTEELLRVGNSSQCLLCQCCGHLVYITIILDWKRVGKFCLEVKTCTSKKNPVSFHVFRLLWRLYLKYGTSGVWILIGHFSGCKFCRVYVYILLRHYWIYIKQNHSYIPCTVIANIYFFYI